MKKYLQLAFMLIPWFSFSQDLKEEFSNDSFQINYPSNWSFIENYNGAEFFILAPLSNADDTFQENVNLIVQNLKGTNLDFEGYIKLTENQISSLKNGVIEVSEQKNMNNTPFQRMIYSGDFSNFKLKIHQYLWVENDKAFILTFTAEVHQYESYEKKAILILNSFKFK